MSSRLRYAWVPGYEGLYIVSTHGDVISLPRETGRRGLVNGYELKACATGGSALYVDLSRDGTVRRFRLDRLVAEAFLGAPPGQCADLVHIDGDQRNNDAFNLAWEVIR